MFDIAFQHTSLKSATVIFRHVYVLSHNMSHKFGRDSTFNANACPISVHIYKLTNIVRSDWSQLRPLYAKAKCQMRQRLIPFSMYGSVRVRVRGWCSQPLDQWSSTTKYIVYHYFDCVLDDIT